MAKGIIAAGHDLTVQAAEDVLSDGGNAYDAAIAAFYAACLAEPVLASPGGGGFLLAKPFASDAVLYDFFVQTPLNKQQQNIDFMPIMADFGEASQEFHIGLGSIAVPGVVRGVFDVHEDLCSMPMRELVAPALGFAREGITCNAFQSYIFEVISPILLHDQRTLEHFSASQSAKNLLSTGDVHYPASLAETLEALAIEGDRLFYEGEIASDIVHACDTAGGLLTLADLKQYRCIKRTPLQFYYRRCRILSNPAPSSGGVLIAFALQLLQQLNISAMSADSFEKIMVLILSMDLTQQARLDHVKDFQQLHVLLDNEMLEQYSENIKQRARAYRGTTHISIIDKQGNMAGLTLSNGEGCGHMLGKTGFMLNNMLGEQDLNPHGFFNWQTGQRMTSMMAPGILLFDDGRHVVTGSGGSNRIRSALMQVMINMIDHAMPVEQAVAAPRVHFENQQLNVEGLFDAEVLQRLQGVYPECKIWQDRNLFFGGAHSVMQQGKSFSGAGDLRRGGVCRLVS